MHYSGIVVHKSVKKSIGWFSQSTHHCVFTQFRPQKILYLVIVLLMTLLSPGLAVAEDNKTDAKTINFGKRIFQQACYYCHQKGGIGKPGVAPSLVNPEFLSIASDQFLEHVIRNGRNGTRMPPFGYLGDQKITAIVAYLRSHAKGPSRAEKVAAQPKSNGDPTKGKEIFDRICLGCHGPGGNGYDAGGTGTAIGKKAFLAQVSDGFIRTTIKEGRSNTRMRGFQGPAGLADLSDEEIDNIIAYLRTAPGTHVVKTEE